MDVTAAFLYSEVDAEIYVEQLPGFIEQGKVCLLEKALYSLKQASRI